MPNVAWDLITKEGPFQELEGHSFPKVKRRSTIFNTILKRRLPNGEIVRVRLFDTEERLFCFRFKWHHMVTNVKGSLTNGGLSHWRHLGIWLLRHELSQGHVRDDTMAWNLWHLSTKIRNKQNVLDHIRKGKKHRHSVLQHIIAIVHNITMHFVELRKHCMKLTMETIAD